MTSQVDRFGSTPGSGVKPPVRMATTANITLSGLQTVDSVVGAAEDRVLVKDNTDGTENGVWVMKTGAWERAKDYNASDDLLSGILIPAGAEGGAGAGIYQVTYTGAFALGTTDPTFTLIA